MTAELDLDSGPVYSVAFYQGTVCGPYAVIEQSVAAQFLVAHDHDDLAPVALLLPGPSGAAIAVGPAEWLLTVRSPLVLYRADEVTRRPLLSLSEEDLSSVDIGAATGLVVCEQPDCPDCVLTLARLRGRTGAYLCGLAQGAVDAAVRRVKARVQFGRPIGSNQAVAFQLAALTARLTALQALGEQVVARIESGPADADALTNASRLLAACAELAVEATTTALHLHGAFGLRSDQDAQRFYRKACAFSVRHGTAAQLRLAGSTRGEGSR
jgi:hypothetical protein